MESYGRGNDYAKPVARLLAILALGLLIAGAIRLRAGALPELDLAPHVTAPNRATLNAYTAARPVAYALLLAGGALFGVACIRQHLPAPPRSVHTTPTRWRPLPLASGAVALLIFAEASGQWLGVGNIPAVLQFALLVTGCTLVTWGLGGLPPHTTRPRLTRSHALLITLTALALVLRLWKLNTAVHLFVDELNFATAAMRFWSRNDVPLLMPISNTVAFPQLYAWWQSLGVDMLGRNLGGLRLTSALLGTFTIPALYALTRALGWERRVALLAAGLLAVYPPHIHFSRLALNNVADPLVGTLALAALVRGLRGQTHFFALGGVLLGLTQYFYEGGRLLFPALALVLVAIAILRPPRPNWRAMLALPVGAMLVALPVYYTLLARDLPLAARSDEIAFRGDYWERLASGNAEAWTDHLAHAAQSIHIYAQIPEGSVFYAGDTPLLLVYLVPLLVAGLAVTFARGHWLPVLWLAMATGGNTLMTGPPSTARFVVVFPALMLLCATGLHETVRILAGTSALPRLHLELSGGIGALRLRGRFACGGNGVRLSGGISWGSHRWNGTLRGGLRLAGALLASLWLCAAGVQIAYYAGPHLDRFNYQVRADEPYPDGDDAMFRAADFSPGTAIYLVSDPRYSQHNAQRVLNFLADGLVVQTLLPSEVTPDFVAQLPHDTSHAFFVAPDQIDLLSLLNNAFPLGTAEISPYNVPLEQQFVLYFAPRVS